MAKYRRIFLEEGADHLGEISHALFDLEKEMGSSASIDVLFRMAHSLKSMAASLGYDPIAELAHRMEDRMEGIRAAGCVRSQAELALLFRGLESLEAMVAAVSRDEAPTAAEEQLLALLTEEPTQPESEPEHTPDPHPQPDHDSPERVGGEPKKVLS